MKRHIRDYSSYFDYDESIRTPASAYFFNGPAVTETRPYYNCSDIDPISGKYSAVFKNANKSNLFFYQKCGSGNYDISLYVRGTKGATVSLVWNANVNKKWQYNEPVKFQLPDRRLYKLKTSFVADDFQEQDYFLAGVGVVTSNGTIQVDNMCLEKKDR